MSTMVKAEQSSKRVLPTMWKNGGFTLAEVLAAVLLLSIGLLAVLSAIQAARDTQRRAVYISVGRNIAQSRIEELRSAPIDTLTSLTFPGTDSSLPSGNTISVSVSPYPDSSQTDLYRATVTVTWPEKQGTRRICYETLITRS